MRGTLEAATITNLAREATTSSIASRMFALQRQIVGLPYVITENTVLTWQRDKAAFLKRLISEPETAKLLHNIAVNGTITEKTIGWFRKYLIRVYSGGGGIVQVRDDLHTISDEELRKSLQENYENNGGLNQKEGFDWDTFLEPYGFNVEETSNFLEKNREKIRTALREADIPIISEAFGTKPSMANVAKQLLRFYIYSPFVSARMTGLDKKSQRQLKQLAGQERRRAVDLMSKQDSFYSAAKNTLDSLRE